MILCQVWAFVLAALQASAERTLGGLVVSATALLAAGMAFGYFLALPAAVRFLTT